MILYIGIHGKGSAVLFWTRDAPGAWPVPDPKVLLAPGGGLMRDAGTRPQSRGRVRFCLCPLASAYRISTSFCVSLWPGASSRTKYTPEPRLRPLSSRPCQTALWGPAGRVPSTSVATRRPDTS